MSYCRQSRSAIATSRIDHEIGWITGLQTPLNVKTECFAKYTNVLCKFVKTRSETFKFHASLMQDDSLNTAMLKVFGKSTVLEAPTKVFMQRQ